MTATGRQDLDAILQTIREVEDSLERRYARAEGVLIMLWGLVGFVVFAFYQLVQLNHDAYHALLGPFLPWVWVVPVAIGYVASALVGARLGRMSAQQKRNFRGALVPGVVTTLLALVLVLTGRYDLIYGVLTLVAGLTCLAKSYRPGGASWRLGIAAGAAVALVGAALLAWPTPWSSLVAGLAFGIGFVGLGTVKYRTGA